MVQKKSEIKKISDYFICNPGPQQQAFELMGKGYTIFYGGARGGGKSHLALLSAVWACKKYPNLTVGIVRRYFDELRQNFIEKLEKMFPSKHLGYVYKEKQRTAVFPNGSVIKFRSADKIKDMDKILGLEYQLLILDEGPLFPEEMFHKCYGSVRNANDNGFIATVLITGNPGGISHNYFKTRFIKPEYDKWNPGELKEKDKYKFIQAKVADNPKLGKEYTDKLEALPEHLRRAWLEGDWDVFEGQFFDMWDPRVHVVKEFDIPEHWQKWAGMDLGYTEKHPTVVEWFAQDPITLDVYMYNEWVSQPKGSVEEYTEQLKDIGAMNTRIPIYADPSMWNSTTKTNSSQESPAMLMMREGLPLLIAENNRLNGWRIMKEWLHWGNNKMPKLYVFNCCQMFIETVGRLQYNRNTSDITKVEDLDTKGPDDAVDAVRYALATCGIPCPTHNNKDENTKYQEMLKVQVLDYDPHYERYGEIEIPQIDYSYFEDVGSYF